MLFDIVIYYFLNSRDPKSTAGLDYNFSRMLQELSPEAKISFFNILNEIWMTGTNSELLVNLRIKPIRKRGKDRSNIENYRPISLPKASL